MTSEIRGTTATCVIVDEHYHGKAKKMQCKHIPDLPVLQFLKEQNGYPSNWYFANERDVSQAMPQGIPEKLVLAKMRMLMARGLVDGCGCGCRGDFVLTAKGEEFIVSAAR